MPNDQIAYTVKKSKRARRMRLAVHSDGRVVVTLPWMARENVAQAFIKEKRAWLLRKLAFYKQFTNTGRVSSGKKEYAKHKAEAHTLVRTRVEHFNAIYQHAYGNISVRDQKTRWGSCSRQGNLNFNYKILFLAPSVRDYVIVHELCHLKEFNHSPKFWALVAQVVPDHKEIRKELKKAPIRI